MSDSLKVAANGAKLLHEAGLIYEINRKILHPLGLALYFSQQGDGTIDPGIGVMESPNHEPIEFEVDPERDRERVAQLAAFVDTVLAERTGTPVVSQRVVTP